jgi:hypothetical protein
MCAFFLYPLYGDTEDWIEKEKKRSSGLRLLDYTAIPFLSERGEGFPCEQ